jgi:hypothetical protein
MESMFNQITKIWIEVRRGHETIGSTEEYSAFYDGPVLTIVLKKPINYSEAGRLTSRLKNIYATKQIYDDEPFDFFVQGYEWLEGDKPLRMSFGVPGQYKQESRPKIICSTTGEVVFGYTDEEREWLSKKLDANIGADTLAEYIVSSYNDALNNLPTEFFYLFQILEAVESKYSHRHTVCKKLCIDNREWGEVAKILNERRYHQSRHRGQTTGGTEMASTEEIWRARLFVKEVIIKYIISTGKK